ncbi:MAG: penicillin-binding protein 2 [Peptococcaceae bacterium]|nr:penicillin-binding protein 2 [Peptococcaceae bacterium]
MERKIIERRMQILLTIIGTFFLILVGRLVYMQLVQNDKFSTLASENRMRLITIPAPRGEVFDRNGVKVVGNQPVYTVSIMNLGKKDMGGVVSRLASILGINPAEIQSKIDQQKSLFEPVKVATKVPPEVVTRIAEERINLPGVVVDIEPVRDYPAGNILSHVMGYVRQINERQLEANKDKGYKPGDQYGQSGLENQYEQYLRGKDGARQVEVDSMARPVRDLGVKEPVPGDNLILTIDARVQKAAEEALAKSSKEALRQYPEATAGAAVAIDVRTGAVLAMASYPAYDAAKLSGELSTADYNLYFNNKTKPMLNRALLPYAPGSTFKMIVAMAGLESGKVTPAWAVSDPGVFYYDGQAYHDWQAGGHGSLVNMIRAIKVSCDIYFYQLGLIAGIDEIARIAAEFGLGQNTGIDLPGEEPGVLPGPASKFTQRLDYLGDRAYQKAREIENKYKDLIARAASAEERKNLYKKRSDELIQNSYEMKDLWELAWHDYDTIISSIGQGDNRYTMLELANYIATIANGGTRYKPYLVQQVVSPDGKVLVENKPQVVKQVSVSPQTLAVIRQGMHEVTLPPDGTAYGLFDGLPPAAAKTGTAEVAGHSTHALFVAYAPYDNPEIAVAVVMEHAGHGGTAAGPVAREMMAAYFGVKLQDKKLTGTE